MALTPTKKYIDINGLGLYHEESAPEMTYAEWQALPASKLSDGREYHITDLTVSGVEISDSVTTTNNVWSASKVNTELGTKANENPTFSEASTRANIASGESFATILGKIKKFFSDLKNGAFMDVKITTATSALTGATSCTITDDKISSSNCLLEVIYENSTMTDPVASVTAVSGTTATIGFKALTEDTSFRIRVTSL